MNGPVRQRWLGAAVIALLSVVPARASAQTVETVGSRALGMGGAFVAVANDSSATWWNPGALADGPFLDMTLGRSVTGVTEQVPGFRTSVSQFSLTTPPVGFSYYRLRITEIAAVDPTADPDGSREDEQSGIPLRSLAVSQLGVTVLHSLMPGFHAGVTVKYLRGRARSGVESAALPPSELLDRADDLGGGDADAAFDTDIGVLVVGGPLRLGAVVRNAFEAEFEGPEAGGPEASVMRLPRQVRGGAAFDGTSLGVPLTVAFDADLRRYATPTGDRRVVALGAEHWLVRKRLAVRGGTRLNTVGAEERVATGGVTVGVRSGLYLDGHIVRGGNADERGWGMAARVSF